MPAILKNIQVPNFPEKEFRASTFGNLQNDFQKTLNEAIKACHLSGGGKVIVPKGEYFCKGSIFLLSNVHLFLEEGCQIKFGTNPNDYLPLVKTRWEGTVCYNYSALVYAYQQKNIAITGKGILDGQCEDTWSKWKKGNNGENQDKTKPIIRQMGNDKTPENQRKFGEGFYLRPSLIEFYECENIWLKDFTAKSSPFWTIHPIFSKNITIQNLIVRKGTTNDDGIDPDSSEYVLIENCDIDTDDDPISIKAGRDQDAWERKGSENIVVRNCQLRSNVGNAFCIGSEMSGGVKNVFVENCKVSKADNVINFKANLDRGGFIENIFIRNIQADSARKTGILFQMDYHSYRGGNFPPLFKNFFIENVSIQFVEKLALRITGVENRKIENIFLQKINIGQASEAKKIAFTQNVLMQGVKINNQSLE
jgi:polygalacturonase